jgi:hypothetical protein
VKGLQRLADVSEAPEVQGFYEADHSRSSSGDT